MALAASILYVNKAGSQLRVGFKLTPSGVYTTGGDVIPFVTATQDAKFVGMVAAVEALGAPLLLDIWSNGGNITTVYVPVLGTTIANCKMMGYSALTTEFTGAAAYPASALADTIVGEAIFNSL